MRLLSAKSGHLREAPSASSRHWQASAVGQKESIVRFKKMRDNSVHCFLALSAVEWRGKMF